MYGPFLNPIGGGQALTSPKRHSLGRPLPYQLADTARAAPEAKNFTVHHFHLSIKFFDTVLRKKFTIKSTAIKK